MSLWPDRNGTPVGFRARNAVRISVFDLSKIGEIVASGLSAR